MNPDANTMAFGGVATGSMKAIDPANAAAAIRARGSIPKPTAAPAKIGMAMVVVAVLEVISVSRQTSVTSYLKCRNVDHIFSASPTREECR